LLAGNLREQAGIHADFWSRFDSDYGSDTTYLLFMGDWDYNKWLCFWSKDRMSLSDPLYYEF
jgi:hypothetical protein